VAGARSRVATFNIPKAARAGHRFAARVSLPAASEAASGDAVDIPSLSCSATLGGLPLDTVARTAGLRSASCVWRLPAPAHGRTLRGVVSVDTGRRTVRRVFTRRVR
jgi:hypothetical protein